MSTDDAAPALPSLADDYDDVSNNAPLYPEQFMRALALTLEIEGLYSNRKLADDPGGETFMGVSRVYHPKMWKGGRPSVPAVVDFYYREFWLGRGLDVVAWPSSLVIFDFGINSGGAVKAAQRHLGLVADGVIGPKTASALGRVAASEDRLTRLNVARIRYMMSLDNWAANANGWLWRVLRVQGECARCFPRTEPFDVMSVTKQIGEVANA